MAIISGTLFSFASNPVISSTAIYNIIQEEFTEVESDQLPEAVKDSIKISYPEAKIDKIYVNDRKEYKIEISVEDQKAAVYADADGNWIKK